MGGTSAATSGWSSYAPIYMTSLTTSRRQQNSTQDLFGNLRIPSFDTLASPAAAGTESWRTVDYSQEVAYSSLLGVPVAGIPPTGNLSFNLVSRYFAIDCNNSMHLSNSSMFLTGEGLAATEKGGSFIMQYDSELNPDPGSIAIIPFNVTSLNAQVDDNDVSNIQCSLAPRDVESSVSCQDQSCHVTAMRDLTMNIDAGSWWRSNYLPATISFHYLPLSTLGPLIHSLQRSTLTEVWLQDPYSLYTLDQELAWSNLSQISLPTFSERFELVYNTFWESTYGGQYLLGNLSTNMTSYDTIWGETGTFGFNTTQTTVSSTVGEQYDCNRAFAAFLIIVSCILLLAGMASLILMNITLAPDILGFVSSHTRDNPFAELAGVSVSDGLARAKVLKDCEVTIGDVNVGSETGYIALAVTAAVRPLQRDRLYY